MLLARFLWNRGAKRHPRHRSSETLCHCMCLWRLRARTSQAQESEDCSPLSRKPPLPSSATVGTPVPCPVLRRDDDATAHALWESHLRSSFEETRAPRDEDLSGDVNTPTRFRELRVRSLQLQGHRLKPLVSFISFVAFILPLGLGALQRGVAIYTI